MSSSYERYGGGFQGNDQGRGGSYEYQFWRWWTKDPVEPSAILQRYYTTTNTWTRRGQSLPDF